MDMEDGGRSTQGRPAAKKKKDRAAKKKKDNDAVSTSSREQQPRHAVPFGQMPGITRVLRERLEALGATEPSFMIGKSLAMSDVNQEQARLLFSCKRESLSLSPVTAIFTETEKQFVGEKPGLLVTAFDRAGRSYDLTCKYLVSNAGYRFITAWKPYVIDNGLGVAMRVELWWFRSRKLHNQYELRQGEDGKEKKVPVMVDNGHPDGSLGLVLLHYDNELLEPEQAVADEAPPVQGMEKGLEQEQAAADKPDKAPPVLETEMGKTTTTTAEHKLADDGSTYPEPIKSKKMMAEAKLADGGDNCAEPMIRERNTMISREDVFNAAIGLLELRKYYSGGEEEEEEVGS